uniref:Isochorismatase-like domain-containing protein n=1 Tax=Panagrolaimus sp. JU765 TaxID=591449 RepID=A0AC34QQH4_9BILA
MASRLVKRINAKQTALLVCDMQDKFRNNIKFFPEIVQISRRLIDAGKILEIPILATEQYPKGLGHTVAELGLEENGIPVFEKMSFSMCCSDVVNKLQKEQVKEVVLCGIEAHVCVYQTCLELLERGVAVHVVADAEVVLCGIEAHVCVYQTCLELLERGVAVHVVADAVSSRSMTDRVFALKGMQNAGAILTTSECVILGLLGGADHPQFRAVQKIIMQSAPDTGLLAHVSHL